MQVVTISSWLNFGGSAPPPGRGSAAGGIFALPYSAIADSVRLWGDCGGRAVFASLWALFHLIVVRHQTPCTCCIDAATCRCWNSCTKLNILNPWTCGHHRLLISLQLFSKCGYKKLRLLFFKIRSDKFGIISDT